MHYTTLGRTGMKVSVAGLGCGGFSQLGLGTGGGEDNAIAIVRQAIGLGVNLFDTAAAYGTEAVLGKAIRSVPRDSVVICTKAPFSWSSGRTDPKASSPASMSRCASSTPSTSTSTSCTAYPGNYGHALEQLAPVLLRERDKGKFRFLGITETAPHDCTTIPCSGRAGPRVGCRHGRLLDDAPERARRVFPVTAAAQGRHAADVRGAQHLSQPGRLAGDAARACRRRRGRRPGSAKPTIRSVSLHEPAPAASSTPPIATSATNPGSMSCCSAPAARRTSGPTSNSL